MQVIICSASGLVGREGARLFASCGPPGSLRRTAAQLVTDGSIKWNETLPMSAPARIVLWDNTLLAPDDYAAAAEIELNQ